MDCASQRSLRKPSQACASAGMCKKQLQIFAFETCMLRQCRHRRTSVQSAGAGTHKHPSIARPERAAGEIFSDTLGTVANVRSALAAQIGSRHPQLCASALCICRVSDMIEMQTQRCTAQIGSYCRRGTVFRNSHASQEAGVGARSDVEYRPARRWRREQTRRRVSASANE